MKVSAGIWFARLFAAALNISPGMLCTAVAAETLPLQRPILLSQRWEENWSVLANPTLPRQPMDTLKYIPLGNDQEAYLSFGANARERIEDINTPGFGTAQQKADTYLLDRIEIGSDLHIGNWQVFVQLEDDRAPWKTTIGAPDADRLDLEQGFVAYSGAFGDGVIKLRAGRQEFGFDLQRFVSARDGPNVRQAYDALWSDYEIGNWRVISFASHPVQYRDEEAFDDYSAGSLVLDGFRVEKRNLGPGSLAVYYLRYQRENGRFAQASGAETRNNVDLHYSGAEGQADFDIEVMGQQGSIGGRALLAWAFGERSGYTFKNIPWSPHLSLQLDAASGNSNRSGTFGTFNPLFPNGSYFTLASLTGDANLVHLKPILSVTPTKLLSLQAAIGLQWRETTHDAIYTFPAIPIANTAGRGALWSAAYLQFDVTRKINANATVSAEFVHYQIGATIRDAGGHNSDYGNLQLSLAW
jgi:hypothetical protein